MADRTPYVGRDRRTPVPAGEHRQISLALSIGCVVSLVGWYLIALLITHSTIGSGSELLVFGRSVSAALFLTAAGMRLATWKLTGEALPAWGSIGLMMAGLTLSFMAILGVLQQEAGLGSTIPGRQLLLLICTGLLLYGAFSPEIQGGLRPGRIAVIVLTAATLFALVIARRTVARLPIELFLRLSAGAQWLIALAWMVLAFHHLRRAVSADRTTELWAGVGLTLMAVGELLRLAHLRSMDPWVLAVGVQLMAAVLILAASSVRLWEVVSATGTKSLLLTGDLQLVRADLVSVEQRQRERLHDARTAVVSVLGASKLLTEPASGSAFDPERLHRMMTAELYRLGAVLDPDQQEPVVEFDLADVLDPLVLAHRIAGAEITVGLSATGVVGRPAAFATAVANILTNARTHAPGTPITIEAAAVGDTVMLTVADQGPGIAPAHRASVLEHGVRGIDSPGSGIGLHTAAAAMQVQGGSLEIGGAPGGGAAIRLTLPAARPMATTKEPVRSLVAKRVSPASASLPTLRTAG